MESFLVRCAAAVIVALALGAVVAQAQTGGGIFNPGGTPLNLSTITTGLGYTPANKAGDTFTGAVAISGANLTVSGAIILPGGVAQVLNNDYSGQHKFARGGRIDWSSSADNIQEARDTGLARPAAGTIEVNNGTAGTITGTVIKAGSVQTTAVNAQQPLWKLGDVTTETCTVDTMKTIRVNIGGVDVKLAPCQ